MSIPSAGTWRCFTDSMPRDNPATNLHACAGCGVSWRAMSAAHCRVCHLTFGDEVGFDAHRRTGDCVAPSVLGLVVAGGVWGGCPVGERSMAPRKDFLHNVARGYSADRTSPGQWFSMVKPLKRP
ncbi:MAG: hypothetical protein WBL53_14320 [Pseudonocardiaceae bacterium]